MKIKKVFLPTGLLIFLTGLTGCWGYNVGYLGDAGPIELKGTLVEMSVRSDGICAQVTIDNQVRVKSLSGKADYPLDIQLGSDGPETFYSYTLLDQTSGTLRNSTASVTSRDTPCCIPVGGVSVAITVQVQAAPPAGKIASTFNFSLTRMLLLAVTPGYAGGLVSHDEKSYTFTDAVAVVNGVQCGFNYRLVLSNALAP